MTVGRRVLFLPGASGDPAFWRPVAERLPDAWEMIRLAWPGLGEQPAAPSIRDLDDLVAHAGARLAADCDVVAQSMGGVVALRLATRFPECVRRLVLVATSGGVEMRAHDAVDWRPDYRREFPHAAGWITDLHPDESNRLEQIAAPTLLLWGDADPL